MAAGGAISGSTIYQFGVDSVTLTNVHSRDTMTLTLSEAFSFMEEMEKRLQKTVTFSVKGAGE